MVQTKQLIKTEYKGERLDDNGRRFYTDQFDNDYVSVTTLLSKYEDKSGLTDWINRIGKDEADRIRDESAERGKIAHSQIEDFFDNLRKGTEPKQSYDGHALAAINGFYSKVTPVREEGVLLWEPRQNARLAGRFDQIVNLPDNSFLYRNCSEPVSGGLLIADLKTKDKQPRLDKLEYILKHLLQISTYAAMLKANEGLDIKGGCIVYAVNLKRKKCCRVVHIDKESMDFYWSKTYEMLLDYYGIKRYTQTWKELADEASCTYDFLAGRFISYEPKEIV